MTFRYRRTSVSRIPHDFRRTAVRHLERATQATYRRHAIADEGMLADAAAKLERLHEAERLMPGTAVPLRSPI